MTLATPPYRATNYLYLPPGTATCALTTFRTTFPLQTPYSPLLRLPAYANIQCASPPAFLLPPVPRQTGQDDKRVWAVRPPVRAVPHLVIVLREQADSVMFCTLCDKLCSVSPAYRLRTWRTLPPRYRATQHYPLRADSPLRLYSAAHVNASAGASHVPHHTPPALQRSPALQQPPPCDYAMTTADWCQHDLPVLRCPPFHRWRSPTCPSPAYLFIQRADVLAFSFLGSGT